jgi:hypothetical protein
MLGARAKDWPELMQASATSQMAACRLVRTKPSKYAIAVLGKGEAIAFGLRLALAHLDDSEVCKIR